MDLFLAICQGLGLGARDRHRRRARGALRLGDGEPRGRVSTPTAPTTASRRDLVPGHPARARRPRLLARGRDGRRGSRCSRCSPRPARSPSPPRSPRRERPPGRASSSARSPPPRRLVAIDVLEGAIAPRRAPPSPRRRQTPRNRSSIDLRRRRHRARRPRPVPAAGLAVAAVALARPRAAAAAARRARSTRACGSCARHGRPVPPLCEPDSVQRKLVLVVVDSLRTDMLLRAVEAGDAPTFKALLERGELVGDCVSSFPSVTPVCTSEITTGVRPDRHLIPGMNWYHRAEQRYVEYGSSFEATRAFGLFRSLYDTVYNLNMGHLNHETLDPLRAARRRRAADRLHAVPDLPRPDPPRGRASRACSRRRSTRRQVPPRGLGAGGALLRRALLVPQGRPASRPWPGRTPATPTRPASAATWSSTTSTTSCSSRSPTTTTTPTATARRRREARSRSPTTRSPSSSTPTAASTRSSTPTP